MSAVEKQLASIIKSWLDGIPTASWELISKIHDLDSAKSKHDFDQAGCHTIRGSLESIQIFARKLKGLSINLASAFQKRNLL